MNSAFQKIQRAEKHLIELTDFLRKRKPFTYELKTNYKTGERSLYPQRDELVTDEVSIIFGDLIHNLRSALDHVYWECTHMYAKSEGEKKKIQFPITDSLNSLRESVLTGLPKRVSEKFSLALENLKPYRQEGDLLLCAIHDLDITDKHKLLISNGDLASINSEFIQKHIPDFPDGFINCSMLNGSHGISWSCKPLTFTQRRKFKIPSSNIIVEEVNLPVEIMFPQIDKFTPAVNVVQKLIEVTKNAVNVLYAACDISEKV